MAEKPDRGGTNCNKGGGEEEEEEDDAKKTKRIIAV